MTEDRNRSLLEMLIGISREIAGAPDLRTVLQRLMLTALEHVGGERGSIVVLDDLGAERRTEWAQEKVYEVVDARYTAGLRTIACSNRQPESWDERILSRLCDRSRGVVVRLSGPDLRLEPGQ